MPGSGLFTSGYRDGAFALPVTGRLRRCRGLNLKSDVAGNPVESDSVCHCDQADRRRKAVRGRMGYATN